SSGSSPAASRFIPGRDFVRSSGRADFEGSDDRPSVDSFSALSASLSPVPAYFHQVNGADPEAEVNSPFRVEVTHDFLTGAEGVTERTIREVLPDVELGIHAGDRSRGRRPGHPGQEAD